MLRLKVYSLPLLVSGCVESVSPLPAKAPVVVDAGHPLVKIADAQAPDVSPKTLPVGLDMVEENPLSLKRYVGRSVIGNCKYEVESMILPPRHGVPTLKMSVELRGYPVPAPDCPSPREIVEWGFTHYKESK